MQSPVFIVGVPRSGTSLLSTILNAHSRLAISPETHYFTRCRDGPVEGRAHAEELVDCLFRQPGVGDIGLTEKEAESIRSAVAEYAAPTHRDILQALFRVYLEREGKPFWGEKTPDHWQHVPVIHETFPEAVFLAIVRDPRDVSLSLRKVPWNQRQTVIDHARQWTRYARLSERYKADDDLAFKEIRYEDLLTDPETIVRDVLNFLDAPYEPQLDDFYRAEFRNVDPAREPWKTKTGRPIDPSNKNKWLRQMPLVERKLMQRICGSQLEVKGYPTEAISWRLSMAKPFLRLIWSTAAGRWHRLVARPWYVRPEATTPKQ